ncbi:MAG TPA: PD-(D/E)XK nuclease family protein [Bryobacteraceae bacterium]
MQTVKSRSNGRLLEAAAGFHARHRETLAIVAGRVASEKLMQAAGGAAGLHRISLIALASSLARGEMAKRGIAPLSGLGLEAVTARIAYQALEAGELQYFEPIAALPGFARALARTLGELRLGGIEPDALPTDLARLLVRYQDELAARSLADLAKVLELAAEGAEHDRHNLLGLPVLLLDVPLESKRHREFFEAVARRAPDVLVLTASAEEHSEGPSTPLEHLRRFVFSQTPAPSPTAAGFEMFSAPGEGLEAVEIARRILRLATEGVKFDEIAILLRHPERYQPMIEDALRRARIPAWFSRGTTRPDPSGRAFLAILACAVERCSASRFAEYLAFGQLPDPPDSPPPDPLPPDSAPPVTAGIGTPAGERPEWVGPEDELLSPDSEPRPQPTETTAPPPPAPAAWEKLLVDAAVIGGRSRWARRLEGLEREFELRLQAAQDDEPLRLYLLEQIERLRSLSAFALPLIERLDQLPRAARWHEWLERLQALAEASLRRPEGVLAVLAEFEPMGEVGPVSLEQVAETLSERLRFLRAETPERRWGRVFVGSIDEVRGAEFPVVFLPGLAEGLFPQRVFEDPLLLDEARRELGHGLALRHDRNSDERERLLLALAAARDRFIASYPRMDVAEARPRVPSFYALELPRALEGALPKLEPFEEQARAAAPARLNWPAPPQVAEAIDDAEYDLVMLTPREPVGLNYLMDVNANLARSLRARWSRWHPSWKEADGFIVSDQAALEALAGQRLTARAWSPSSLEQFAVCPYKFALHGIHRLRPREESVPLEQLDPLTRGALFHEVQCAALSKMKREGHTPSSDLPRALEICDAALDRVAAHYKETLAPAIERVWKSAIEDLRTDLRGWLQHAARDDDDWEPIHFELSFGLQPGPGHDPASVAEEIALAEGVRLRGSIDLIERHVDTGALRVTDHKSGKAPETVPLATGGGRALQPLLYSLAAERIFHTKVEGGRLFYATQRGGYRAMYIPANERGRGFLAQLLRNIDGSIGSGFLPPYPEKDSCSYCDYRIVCGPYEERRTLREKDARDERLQPLFEIRGSA